MRPELLVALRSVALLAVALWAAPASAQPRVPPVTVELEGAFGNDALVGDATSAVLVRLTNNTAETFRGTIELDVREWDGSPRRTVLPIDLPPHERREALLTPWVSESAQLSARYVAGGATLGPDASVSAAYSAGASPVIVLADPPRIRAALLGLETDVLDTSYGGSSTRRVTVPLGIVSMHATTGDPVAPDHAAGWAGASGVVASIPMLSRLSAPQLAALSDWARSGGVLVLLPRTDADLAHPLVREVLGRVQRGQGRMFVSPTVPMAATELAALECERGELRAFGCVGRLGHGVVALAGYDAASPTYADAPEVRELVSQLIAWRSDAPLPFARGRDSTEETWWATATFSRMRAALDPNEGYRPALGLVALVLLLYVLAIGPLNFRFVQSRGTPTLALVTTPILALGCVLVMLAVGYLGKGVTMRYRRAELVSLRAGDSTGVGRRYTGLFLTRPSTIELAAPDRGVAMRVSSSLSDRGPTHVAGGERERLTEMRGGLWETIFVREDRIADLGGPIELVLDGRRLAAVRNGSARALRSAFVVDSSGYVYPVGDVAAGATVAIPLQSSTSLATTATFTDASDYALHEMGRLLGLDETQRSYLHGLLRVAGGSMHVDARLPVLWAMADPEAAPMLSPELTREEDLVFVRVLAREESSAPRAAAEPPPVQGAADGVIGLESLGTIGAADAGVLAPDVQRLIDALEAQEASPETETGGAP